MIIVTIVPLSWSERDDGVYYNEKINSVKSISLFAYRFLRVAIWDLRYATLLRHFLCLS